MSRIFLGALLILLTASAHAASMIRVACTDDAAGAVVSVNGVLKGDCPFDTQVSAGRVVVRAVRTVNAETERVFESSFTIGDDVIKRVDVVLGQPQFSAEGLRQQALRRQQQEAEAVRQKQAQLEREQKRRQAVAAALAPLAQKGAVPGNGSAFKDCEDCPAMVLVPSTQPGGEPLAVGQFEITRGQFAKFVRDTGRQIPLGCSVWERNLLTMKWWPNTERSWQSPGFEQTDEHPAVCISWYDARDFADWLSKKTGQRYRLPFRGDYVSTGILSAADRGQIRVPLPWGQKDVDACRYANVFDAAGQQVVSGDLGKPWPCSDAFPYTAPVGSFLPNPQGLHDMVGNVSEWLDWSADDVAALGARFQRLGPMVVRGDSWADSPELWGSRSYWWANDERPGDNRHQAIGFRVVRVLAVPDAALTQGATLSLVAQARPLDDGRIQLTEQNGQSGAVWLKQAVSTTEKFDISADITSTAIGEFQADGFALVLQSDGPNAIGQAAHQLGAWGLKTWVGGVVRTFTNNQIGLANGNLQPAKGQIDLLREKEIKARLRLKYDPTTQRLEYTVRILLANGQLREFSDVKTILLAQQLGSRVYAGVTAATGGYASRQVVDSLTRN